MHKQECVIIELHNFSFFPSYFHDDDSLKSEGRSGDWISIHGNEGDRELCLCSQSMFGYVYYAYQ